MCKSTWWILSLAWAILIFYLTSIPNLKVSEDTLISSILSNMGHFLFFGVQAVLLRFALASSTSLMPVGLTSLYGILDELHQIKIPGRSADPVDWVLDTLGACVFVYLFRKYQTRKV